MKVLVIGGGGREHAICLALSKSPQVTHIWCAPGNGGTAHFCENLPIGAEDLPAVLDFCKTHNPDLTVVAPDDPLALGMVDLLESHGFRAFGPRQNAARLESSKVFAKSFMQRHGIPTGDCRVFGNAQDAFCYASSCSLPVVVKADGLAKGKGVIICETRGQVEDAVTTLTDPSLFGSAGARIIFEEFLTGPEVSVMCFTDGQHIALMPPSQDHKRAFDGDKGPNTGGMGAYSPVPAYDDRMAGRCMAEIFLPTIQGMQAENTPFCGILYFSLMLTARGPVVIEYNARFGDPEAQAVLPLLDSDLLDIFLACMDGTLASCDIRWMDACSCCVVIASGGYPDSYQKGFAITGLDAAVRHAAVFHAGTALKDGRHLTSGGRVLGVTGIAPTLEAAVKEAYAAAACIEFNGAFYRRDIAGRALGRSVSI